ncbi:hypothetical protein ADG881_23 [Alcanivorax sp. DG881]|jgi:hypothetical protein|nr:hypothetical protein ADG881_23 [Alcanivorax sp. DG881]
MASLKALAPISSADGLKALKCLAKELLSYSDRALAKAIKSGALIEVQSDE